MKNHVPSKRYLATSPTGRRRRRRRFCESGPTLSDLASDLHTGHSVTELSWLLPGFAAVAVAVTVDALL